MTSDQLHSLYAYSSDVDQAIKKIAAMMLKPTRSIIGLAGGPGSGKSTFASYLYSRLNQDHPNQVACLAMDGFHLTKQTLAALPNAEEAFARRGAPWTFDCDGFVEKTQTLKDLYLQQDTFWPSFDHKLGDPIENDIIVSKQAKVILIEGLYLMHDTDGWQKTAPLLDHSWFLDTPLELALERLAQRHMQAWNISHQEAMARIQNSDCLNARTVLASKANADWLIYI